MWFFYSLYFAIWSAVSALIIKKLTTNLSSINILFLLGLFSIPFTVILVFIQGGIPVMSFDFFKFMFFSSVIDFGAFLLAIEGLRRSNVSLVSPMASFSPVFTTFIAMFALREIPSVTKIFAIFIIVIGAYFLQASEIKNGIFEPIKKLFSDKGVKMFFAANFLWAITPIFQKKAIFETSPTLPLMASLMGSIFVFAYTFPLVLRQESKITLVIKKNFKLFLVIGILGTFSQFAAFQAFSLAKLGYVTAIFKLSGVFGVLGGALFFKEQNIKEKIIGAVIMLVGTIALLY